MEPPDKTTFQAEDAGESEQGSTSPKRARRSLLTGIVIIGLLGATLYGVDRGRNQSRYRQAAAAAGCADPVAVPNRGREHRPIIDDIAPQDYNSNPPTSGPHYVERIANWGPAALELPVSTLVQNLEHGGIIIHYKNQSSLQVEAINRFVNGYSDGVISNPNPGIDAPIVITSWDRKQSCETFNAGAVAAYIKQSCNQGPEKVTTCRKTPS